MSEAIDSSSEPIGPRRGNVSATRSVVSAVLTTIRVSLMFSGAVALSVAGALATSAQTRSAVTQAFASVVPFDLASSGSSSDVQGNVSDSESADESEEDVTASSDPKQRAVTRYLSKRYRVAQDAVGQVVAAAFIAGRASQVDPLLVLAVVAIESSMNPFAESAMGAQGLMQVMTHVHTDKFAVHGGDSAALDPVANVKVGSEILADLIRRGGSVERGLQLYVGAGNLSDDGGYGSRVLAEHARLRQVVNAAPSGTVAGRAEYSAKGVTG